MDPLFLALLKRAKDDPTALDEAIERYSTTEPEPEAESEPEPEPETETVETAEPEAEPEASQPEPQAPPEPEPEPKPEPEAVPEPKPEPVEQVELPAEPDPLAEDYRELLMDHHGVPAGLRALLPRDPKELKGYLSSDGYKELAKNLTPAPQPTEVSQPKLDDRAEAPSGPNLKNIGLAFNGVL